MINRSRIFICVILALLTAFWLSACSPGGVSSPDEPNNQGYTNTNSYTSTEPKTDSGSSTGAPSITESAAATDSVDRIPTDWEASAHAQSYVIAGDGTNSSCSRCHAPVNFIPSVDEIPSSCFICKFEVSVPPPLIEQDAWTNIDCNICHEPDRKGNIPAEYSWLEVPILLQYAEVDSSTGLCLKCHQQLDLPGHMPQPDLANAHADMVCTDCHNAHSLQADCSTGGCHDDALAAGASIVGHDADHQNVSCVACHQAGGFVSGMSDSSGEWLPMISITSINGGTELVPYSSHDIVKESACDRCHFSGNPWNLKIYSGQ